MSIAVFSNFVNGIPTTIYDGKDVSMVLLVDPPADLPAFFLANKGVLDTASKTIKVYDETGNTVTNDFDISGTDLKPITDAIEGLESRVGTNETDIGALQSDVSTNTTNIGTNASDIGTLQGRATDLETTTGKHTTDIQGLQSATGTNASDISALTLRVGKNETDIAAVVLTANAADELSKSNKDRLDKLPAPPSLEGYIKTGDDASLKSVSFGDNTKIDTQPDLGLVLQGDYIYGKADSGYEHFFVESGNFNVKSKKIQKVNDGQAEDDAVNLRQLGAVESKADAAQTTANTADALSKTNQTDIGNLSSTVGTNSSQISTNTKDIGDLSDKLDTVESTANAADTLSKDNKTRLDNLPDDGLKPTGETWEMLGYPILSIGSSDNDDSASTVARVKAVDGRITAVSNVANAADTLSKSNESRLDALPADVTPRVAALEANALQKDENSFDAKSFKVRNLASGEDADSNAANIGDVKRIATEGSGLKPTENEWDMLTYPVTNIGTSDVETSAATVGQVNAVDGKVTEAKSVADSAKSKADANEGSINSLTDTVSGNTTTIGQVKTTADNADSLSKTNAGLLENALLSDEYGWDVNNLNVYNVSRLSRTNNAVNSSGLSIGDVDVNLHADTVGITNSNSSNTYAVFSAGGLNLNNYPLTRMGSGGDTDTNAANIGDVKRIATDGSGLKPTDEEWDMLSYPVTNIGTSTIETSAATVGQVNTVDGKVDAVKSTADAADTLSKDNKTRLDNLPPAPDLSGYVKNGEDVDFGTAEINIVKVTKADDKSKFSDILIDGNTNTEMNFVGDTHFYVRNKADNSKGAEAFQIDSSGRFIAKQKVKTPILTNLSTGSTDSSSPNTGFIDLSTASKVKVGAKEDVTFTVDGNDTFKVTSDSIDFSDLGSKALIKQASGQVIDVSVGNVSNVEFTENGLKLTRDVDAHNQNLKNVGDIEHSNNAIILGKSTGNLKVRNVGQITRNSTNEANSITLGSGENTYKSNTHHFLTNDDLDLFKIDSNGLHLKNTHEDSQSDTSIRVDSTNQNTVYDNVGLVYFNTVDKDSGEKKRIFLTSQNGSVTYDHAVRSKEGFTSGTATFNTNTEGAGFVDLRESGEVKLGAHSKVTFAVAGKKPLEITPNKIDFSNLAETMTINHGHNIDVSVSGTKNVAFKSNGMKILANVDGDGHTINHAGDIHFNSGKKLYGNAAAGLELRNVGAIYRGDGNGSNIQFDNTNDVRITGDHIRWFHSDGHQYGGISNTGINLRDSTKIVGLPQGSDDTDATNIGHIKELIAEHTPSGGGVEFENYINRTADGSHTFYETTDGNQNAWVSHTSSSKGTITYTFDYSRQGKEVVAGIENRSQRTIIAKLNRRQSTILTVEVPKYSVFTARYLPTLDKYVYNIGSWFPTEQRVLKLSDLNYMSASDPRDVTKNIINAMPKNTIVIARHESGSGSKNTANANRFISKGDNNACETEEAIAVIIKYDTDRATGFSTTQGGSGKAWSRVLDGKRHAWFTNDTANSFSLSDDINIDDYPEDQLFLTGDKGMMISSFDEDGNKFLEQVSGYNVPKNEQDIAALEIQTEKNRSVTHYFVNESELSYDWVDSERRPLVEVQVLNTMQTINSSSVTVTDNDSHKYSGTYNSVGAIAINSNGDWSVQYVYHNAYKHSSENYYDAFNQANMSWQIIEAENPHTSVGEKAAAVTVQLGSASSLPSSFGAYTIDPNFDDIDSLEFLSAEVPVQYDDINSRVLINFNGAKPSGYVVLK